MVLKYCSDKDAPVTKAESLRLAMGLIGVKRTTGQHPGGIVVVPKERDVYDFTPVQCPADKTENGIITTHFDFNSLHDTILKLDILGHDDPTMLKVLGDMTGVDVRTIPVPDDEVMKLFLSNKPLRLETSCNTESGTLGLPEMGTFMARGMIKETKPTRFYDLVQLMGLSHGTDVWKGNAQDLIKSGTCGVSEVIGCRDSIMTSLMHWGLPPKSAFSIMERVRKGKGLTEENETLMKEHHVPEWYIESCKKIKYMFPKAHAAAYSISSLRIAWFKVYHPAEYYCAFFTVRADEFDARLMCRGVETVRHYREKLYPGFREKEKILLKLSGKEEEVSIEKAQKMYYILELIEEMYCRGIEFLPVDIYKSEATRFRKVSDRIIRPPLNTLPSLSETVANNIVNARSRVEKFLSREDFAQKAGLGESMIALLSDQGCLQDMPETTQIDLFSLLAQQSGR
jgi:DNA polymerase-3 subunit alpha (Gram-positive type)